MNTQILFVGKGPGQVLASPGFIDAVSPTCGTASVGDAAGAMELLSRSPFGAVLSDFQLPDLAGSAFLDQVQKQFPSIYRFMLVELADKKTALQCVGTAHPFIPSPCEGETLLGALDRARQVEMWLPAATRSRFVAEFTNLPSPPSIYFQIVKELRSSMASVESVGRIVAQDPAISGKLLQLVNSAVFGLGREVSNPADAVMFLGIETTKSMVLLAHSYSHFDDLKAIHFSVEALWRHCLATSRLAHAIAQAEFASTIVSDQAFTAGLLHDFGKLILAMNHPETYERVASLARERGIPTWKAEQELFDVSHAEVGAWLLATWGLPLPIVEAVGFHHHPSSLPAKCFSPAIAVHVANAIEHERQNTPDDPTLDAVDQCHLTELGLDTHLDPWRETCLAITSR